MRGVPALQVDDAQLEVQYSIGSDESVIDGLLEAFSNTELAVTETETLLYEWVNTDALEALYEDQHRHVRLSMVLWNYPVVLTPEEIRIFEPVDVPGN